MPVLSGLNRVREKCKRISQWRATGQCGAIHAEWCGEAEANRPARLLVWGAGPERSLPDGGRETYFAWPEGAASLVGAGVWGTSFAASLGASFWGA